MAESVRASVKATRWRAPAWFVKAAPLLLGVLLALSGLELVREHAFDPNNAGLGTLTRSVLGYGPGHRIQCEATAPGSPCVTDYRAAGSPPAVLWLGNSQLHGVNRYQPGQSTAPMLLHAALAPKGLYLVAYSLPNANAQEYRAMFRQLTGQYAIRTIVVGVSLDKFREGGVRRAIEAGGPRAAPAGQTDDSLEAHSDAWLERTLASNSGLWRDRGLIRSMVVYAIQVGHLRALGITSQTPRPVSPALLSENMSALQGLIADAGRNRTRVILYAQPYRSDVPGPTPPGQYRRFLADLNAMAAPGKVDVLDLTSLVPGPQWGMRKDPMFGFEDYDFMHFTAAGHRLLAQAIAPRFGVVVE